MTTQTIVLHDYDHFTFTGDQQAGDKYDNALVGGAGSDILVGGGGNDRLEGGKGDDLLIGGELKLQKNGDNAGEYTTSAAGGDTFVFNFALNHTEGTTYYFRPNAAGTGGDTPNVNANKNAWQNYMDQLALWRAEMALTHGTDQDAASTGIAKFTEKKVVGSLGGYDNSFTTAGEGWTITAHDGNDTIVKWEGDEDKLELKGLAQLDSLTDFDALFDVALDAKGDTVLSWAGGSITVHGMAIADVATFWDAGQVNNWFA